MILLFTYLELLFIEMKSTTKLAIIESSTRHTEYIKRFVPYLELPQVAHTL